MSRKHLLFVFFGVINISIVFICLSDCICICYRYSCM